MKACLCACWCLIKSGSIKCTQLVRAQRRAKASRRLDVADLSDDRRSDGMQEWALVGVDLKTWELADSEMKLQLHSLHRLRGVYCEQQDKDSR